MSTTVNLASQQPFPAGSQPVLPQHPPTLPQVVSRQPIFALSLETFGLGGVGQQTNSQGLHSGASFDTFQRGQSPAGIPFNAANPADPKDQLQSAYITAENARNTYLQLANQLNTQAYQAQAAPNAPLSTGGALPPSGSPSAFQAQSFPPATFQPPAASPFFQQPPTQTPDMMQQQAALAQQQAAISQQQQAVLAQQQQLEMQRQQQAMIAQQQAAEQARLQANQQLQQAQQQAALMQPQQLQPQAAQQAMPPQQPPLGADPQSLSFASVDQLNQVIAQGATFQDRVNAMAELSGVRGQANSTTYELLKGTITAEPPPGALPPEATQQVNSLRQAALWTLGLLNAKQNAAVPTNRLPGMAEIDQIVSSKTTDPMIQTAAIQALQVLNRPKDPTLQSILGKAANNKNSDVATRAQNALKGEVIPLTPGAAPGATPVADPSAMMPPPIV